MDENKKGEMENGQKAKLQIWNYIVSVILK